MKRILLGMGVGLGLLVLPAALPGQGYIGPEEVPYGAGRVLEDHGGPAARWQARSGWIWWGF